MLLNRTKKIEPSRIIGLAENQLRPAVPNSSTSSITDSSGVVKSEKTFAEQVDEALSGKITILHESKSL